LSRTKISSDKEFLKKLEEKKKKVREARSYFRDLAEKNKGWEGVSEIRKWRDRQHMRD